MNRNLALGLFSLVVGALDLVIGADNEKIWMAILGFFLMISGMTQIVLAFFYEYKVMIVPRARNVNSSRLTIESIDKCRCGHSLLDKCPEDCLCEFHNKDIIRGRAIAWDNKDKITLV